MDLATLENQIVGGGDHRTLRGRHLMWALRRMRALLAAIDEQLDTAKARVLDLEAVLTNLQASLSSLDDRATVLEQEQNRAGRVATLPLSAPAGKLLITPGDTNLYIGTGAGNPLRRIPTQALPS